MNDNPQQRPPLKLKKNYFDAAAETEAPPSSGPADELSNLAVLQRVPQHARRTAAQLRRRRRLLSLGWLLFSGLAAGLIYLRFFAEIPELPPALIKYGGMIAVGAVYLCAIFLALTDNMFDGLLAIVVPFYPFYYLFFCSGSFFLRALTAALLAAFGYDCLLFLQAAAMRGIDLIAYWIQHV